MSESTSQEQRSQEQRITEQKSEDPKSIKLSDSQRLKQAVTIHGSVALAAISLWAMGNIWSTHTGDILPSLIALISAIVAGRVLAVLFHEWGHFIGARVAKSYSPIVPRIKDAFMFGFNIKKNSRQQFVSMSIGGPAGNWILVTIVFVFIPHQSLAEVTLLAMVLANAISVTLFEMPIISNVNEGRDPQTELDEALANGSGDKSTVLGYIAGILFWLILV